MGVIKRVIFTFDNLCCNFIDMFETKCPYWLAYPLVFAGLAIFALAVVSYFAGGGFIFGDWIGDQYTGVNR